MPDTLTQAARDLINLQRGGSYSMARDALKHRLYDTRFFNATATDHTYFLQPLGSPWRVGNKTLIETNMRSSGQLPNGQVFLVARMGVQMISFLGTAGTNPEVITEAFYSVMQSSVFEIKIEGREFDYQIHGSEFLPALAVSGQTGATNIAAKTGEFYATGWSRLDPTPIVIDQLISFSVVHRFSNPDTVTIVPKLTAACGVLVAAGSVLKVTLEGLLTRAK